MKIGDYVKIKDNARWFVVSDIMSEDKTLIRICSPYSSPTYDNTFIVGINLIMQLVPKEGFDRKYCTYVSDYSSLPYMQGQWEPADDSYIYKCLRAYDMKFNLININEPSDVNIEKYIESIGIIGKTYYFMHKNHVESGVVLEVQIGKNKKGEKTILYSFAHDLKIPKNRCYKSKEELIKTL